MITNLNIGAGPVELQLSNSATAVAPQSNDLETIRAHGNISIPHFLTVSNSPATIIQSNANGVVMMQTRVVSYGPLFWPIIAVVISLALLVCWMSVKTRGRN